ncbi:MAG TPA: hypothetical protein VMA37_04360 [Acetobacteraceae bacterium]|nr:hypothetical protein [Acetobacteraceae bacterium]
MLQKLRRYIWITMISLNGLLAPPLLTNAISQTTPPMTFQLVHSPSSPLLGYDIFAQGEIMPDTPDVFAEFLQENSKLISSASRVYFNSGGGTLFVQGTPEEQLHVGGLGLGEAIRAAGLQTEVAVPPGFAGSRAECDSACTFAFIGGVSRSVAAGSRFGVHRFESEAPTADVQTLQQLEGVLVDYIGRMGVSHDMFTLMTKAPPQGIYYVDQATMQKLRITTPEQVSARMTYQNNQSVLVMRDTEGAVEFGRMDFYCTSSRLMARGYFDLGGSNGGAAPGVPQPADATFSWSVSTSNPYANHQIQIPAADWSYGGQNEGKQLVEVYVPPALASLMTEASSIWLIVDFSNGQRYEDILGLGLTGIGDDGHALLATLAKSC